MAFTHEDTEPVIARLITEMNRQLGRWVDSFEIVDMLQRDKEGRALVRKAHKQDEFDTSGETALNMMSWWSQRFTSKRSAYRKSFARSEEQPYRYWALELGAPPDDGSIKTFVLTWHPDRSPIPESELAALRGDLQSDGYVTGHRWSTGRRRSGITPGDRFFLFRQKRGRGIVASGVFESSIYEDEGWDGARSRANYADILIETWMEEGAELSLDALVEEVPGVGWRYLQGSGILIEASDAEALGEFWDAYVFALDEAEDEEQSPDEVDVDLDDPKYPVDAVKEVLVNRYERSPQARRACLEKFGYDCSVCGFNFEATYGDIGEQYIHVHHLVDISTLDEGYEIDPKKDLRPVCANCHSMLHTERPAMSIASLKKRLNRTKP